jgi:hypothetical protein
MFFSFKTVGQLQVIHQPLYRPKQIRAGEYAVGRKIGLERVKVVALKWCRQSYCNQNILQMQPTPVSSTSQLLTVTDKCTDPDGLPRY